VSMQKRFFTGQGCILKIFTRVGAAVTIGFCFFVVGCGGVGIATAGIPAISQIIPQTIAAGSDNTSVQIVGAHINNATVVLWNGNPLTTTLVNDTTVVSPVESASLATPGVAEIQLMNSATGSKSEAVAVSIASATKNSPLSITTTSVPNGTVGVPYSTSLTATGGKSPYTWHLTSGNPPAGLSMSSSGVVTGTPTTAGTYSVGLTVTDNSRPAQSRFIAFTVIIAPRPVTIVPLSILTASLPSATVGAAYSQTLNASGGSGVYRWSIVSGGLPSGLALSTEGVISGVLTGSGSYAFTVSASDTGNPVQTRTASLSISVAATPLRIGATSLPGGTAGSAYSQALSVSGGTPGYAWSLASGSLPAGLSLSPSGIISGTPSATGTATFVAGVRDSGNPVQTATISLSINIAATPLNVSSANYTQVTFGRPYSATLQANGGTPGYKWSVASGSLPTGLSLNTAGAISGTPLAGGKASFTAAVQDSSSPGQIASAQMTIDVSAAPLAITGAALPTVTVGGTYSQSLQAVGGAAPYRWSITSGQLPAGLTLAPTTGAITGTASTAGTATFTAAVTDSSSPTQTASLVMSVAVSSNLAPASVNQLSISAPASTTGTVGSAYTQALGVTGGTGPYTWAFSDSFPAGLTLSRSGVISGTPLPGSAGSYNVTVSVTDTESPVQTASSTMSIAIGAAASPLSILSSTLASGTTGASYSQSLQATGGTASYAWSLASGSLPAGLTLSSSGAISGTPTGSGTSTFTAAVIDSSSPAQTKSANMSIAISAAQVSTGGAAWYVRPDGGTRYSTNVTNGQCNGKYDGPYPGSGTNQNCAFNDVRYLWDDGSIGSWGWVIAGGDTVVIRGCAALPGQVNPSSPNCRLGWDNNTSNSSSNSWCWYAPGGYGSNLDCTNPVIPAGTSGAHTRILGGCAYDNNCTPVNTYPYSGNLTQLFSGFGLQIALDLSSTQYVDLAGIELTTHNSAHCNQYGTPAFTHGCSNGIPGADDYGNNGIRTDNTTAHVTLTDVNIHGFTAAGLYGPIGGAITMTRVQVNFNGFAGWNFADTSNTPDASGSSIIGSYVRMEGNGCIEEYPIADPLPMLACYDSNSGGFGDAWSGQDTDLQTFACDHCVTIYNTKDGDIGPHTRIQNYTKTNSFSAFNMGQQWKWGSGGTTPQTVIFENNLTVSGCQRMSQPLTGAPSTYNTNLSLFCRAAGDVMSPNISPGSVWTFANNTFVFNALTLLDVQCYPGGSNCPSTINWLNNVILGYGNMPTVYGINAPAVFYNQAPGSIAINSSYEVEYGIRNGSTCSGTVLCTDPLLLNEPAQSVTAQSALDVFNSTPSTSGFYPTVSSPAIHAGTTGGPSTDYFGTTQTSPAAIGAVVQ